ncbi:MAG: UrcA family protein [Gammaproteobacteria bacterium]|nr:UrcA family protein [Gammaproteobacteria bacterium]MBV9724480.1 UrcA family protein [Gammaproteobacteria bacterium]
MNTNIRTINRTFLAHATATLLVSVLAASNATAGEQLRSEIVKFQDLNVSTPAGAQTLYNRIHAAAKRVCAQSGDWQPAVIACIKHAESTAVGKVNEPSLTAFYRAKTGDRTGPLTANR